MTNDQLYVLATRKGWPEMTTRPSALRAFNGSQSWRKLLTRLDAATPEDRSNLVSDLQALPDFLTNADVLALARQKGWPPINLRRYDVYSFDNVGTWTRLLGQIDSGNVPRAARADLIDALRALPDRPA